MEKRREVYREEGRSKGQETEKKVGWRKGGREEKGKKGRVGGKKVICLLLDPGNQNLLLIQL